MSIKRLANNFVLIADSSDSYKKASRHVVSYYKSALLKTQFGENTLAAKEGENSSKPVKDDCKVKVIIRSSGLSPKYIKQISRNLRVNLTTITEANKQNNLTIEQDDIKNRLSNILKKHRPLKVQTRMNIAKYKRLDREMIMLPEVNYGKIEDQQAESLKNYIKSVPRRFISLVEQKLFGNSKIVHKKIKRSLGNSFSSLKYYGIPKSNTIVVPTINDIKKQYKNINVRKNIIKLNSQYTHGRLITALRTNSIPRKLVQVGDTDKKVNNIHSIENLSSTKMDTDVSDATIIKCKEMRKMFERLTAIITSVDNKNEEITKKINELYK